MSWKLRADVIDIVARSLANSHYANGSDQFLFLSVILIVGVVCFDKLLVFHLILQNIHSNE